MSTTSAYISSTFRFMKSVIWLWDSIGTIHVTGKFSAKDNWSETLIPGKLASRLIRGKNSVNSTIGRKILSELTEDPTYVNPTYPRFVVLKTINIIGTAAFCPSWAKIRLMQVRLIRDLLYIYIYIYIYPTNQILPAPLYDFNFKTKPLYFISCWLMCSPISLSR